MEVVEFFSFRGVVLCSWSFCARGVVVGGEWRVPTVPFTLPGSGDGGVVLVVVFVVCRSVE